MTADDQPPISEKGRLPCRLRHRGSVTPRRPGTRGSVARDAVRCAGDRRSKRPRRQGGAAARHESRAENATRSPGAGVVDAACRFPAAAVPILPFVFLPILQARFVSGAVTVALLIGLGFGRARIAKRNTIRTVLETVSIGVAAALAGVAISVMVDRLFS